MNTEQWNGSSMLMTALYIIIRAMLL